MSPASEEGGPEQQQQFEREGGSDGGSLSLEPPWDFSSSETEKRARPDPAASGCHGGLPTECLAPGLLVAVAEAGCLPGVLSAYGWARSMASVPGPGCPDSLW